MTVDSYENERITPGIDALIRIAQALDVSIDYLLIEGAPRQPLTTLDPDLAEHLHAISELDNEDRAAILRIIDGLITKTRIHNALRDAG